MATETVVHTGETPFNVFDAINNELLELTRAEAFLTAIASLGYEREDMDFVFLAESTRTVIAAARNRLDEAALEANRQTRLPKMEASHG